MRFKNIGGIIVIHLGLKEQLSTLLINQNQRNNLKVLNEFISRRKNHRFGVDYLCVFCYTTCINLYGAIMHIIADIICIPFYVQNKQWDVAIMLSFLMSIAISKVAILL